MLSNIINIDKIHAVYENWSPSDLAFVTDLHYFQNDYGDWCLTMTGLYQSRSHLRIWPVKSQPFYSITLCFYNISEFHLHPDSSNPIQIVGFVIEDISDRQWEKIRFSVDDYENGAIRFFCEKIEICSVSQVVWSDSLLASCSHYQIVQSFFNGHSHLRHPSQG